MAHVATAGRSLLRKVQSLPTLGKVKNLARPTVPLLLLPLALSPAPILTRRWGGPPGSRGVLAERWEELRIMEVGQARWIIWYCDCCEMQDVLSHVCLPPFALPCLRAGRTQVDS
jgi:hypothetical protein